MAIAYGPYSPLKQAGHLYFVSGQIGVDPSTGVCQPTARAQTEQTLKNLELVLAEQELRLQHIVKTTIFLVSMADYQEVNDVYSAVFSDNKPARSTVAVAELPSVASHTPLKVEIEAIAYKE